MGRGMAGADITFDGDRKLHRRPAVFRQRSTIGLHQRHDLAEPAGVHDQPRIADPRRAPHRYVGLPGDIERRPAWANGLRADAGVLDGVEPALVADLTLGPQPTHQRDALVEPWRPLAEADTERVEFRLAVAQADPENV